MFHLRLIPEFDRFESPRNEPESPSPKRHPPRLEFLSIQRNISPEPTRNAAINWSDSLTGGRRAIQGETFVKTFHQSTSQPDSCFATSTERNGRDQQQRLSYFPVVARIALRGLPLMLVVATAFAVVSQAQVQAQATNDSKLAEPISKGQRVFTCGHSFHVWVPGIVADLCKLAEIPGHTQVGLSSIGGSRVIQHWDISDEKNTAKEALRTGKVDVLTLSPIFLPDPGIENFTTLALEHNKDIRVIVQPIWLRWDIYEPTTKRPEKVDHNAITGEELRNRHAEHFQKMDAHIRELNEKYGKTVLYIAPAPQAVIALREKIIAGQAPGLKNQEDLFTDELGHGKPPLEALVGYCNFATIYRRNPIGLPAPSILKQANLGDQEEKLNKLLQELAWDAVVKHPLSGLQKDR